MNDKREQYQGFLHSDDLGYSAQGGKTVKVKIAKVTPAGELKDAQGNVVESEVVHFEKAKKALVLNQTNTRVLQLMFGKDRAGWVGGEILLTVRFITAFGERDVPTIRVVPADGVPLPFGLRKHAGKDKPSFSGNIFKVKGE